MDHPNCAFALPVVVGRRGSRKMTPEKRERALWVGNGLDLWPQFHEKTPRERKKKKNKRGYQSYRPPSANAEDVAFLWNQTELCPSP